MLSADRIARLPPGQRRRKLILCFDSIERFYEAPIPSEQYIQDLLQLIISDSMISSSEKALLSKYANELASETRSGGADLRQNDVRIRACNAARHILLNLIGAPPAEWDLIVPERVQNAESQEPAPRNFFRGVYAYLDDIRSPFNIGSIFRSAEAFGVEKLILSPFCAAPEHKRAERSAMGAVKILPWERVSLEEWLAQRRARNEPAPNIFALETGGTDICGFDFPPNGIAVLGSEELGVSPELLRLADARVSIPLCGLKASLNVATAFGVLLQKWTESLRRRG